MQPLYSLSDHAIVALDGVVVNVRCGLHPWERFAARPNRLSVSVKLFAPLGTSRLADTPIIDYDPIRNHIRSLEQADHIDLLETIVDSVTGACFADPRVQACFVSIRKLDIFAETAGAGIDVFRTRAQWSGA